MKVVKSTRNKMFPAIGAKLALLKRSNFSASTVYVSGFPFAISLSYLGKLSIG